MENIWKGGKILNPLAMDDIESFSKGNWDGFHVAMQLLCLNKQLSGCHGHQNDGIPGIIVYLANIACCLSIPDGKYGPDAL